MTRQQLELRINKLIPVDNVIASVFAPTKKQDGKIEWRFNDLGFTLATEIKSTNLSNKAIERHMVSIIMEAIAIREKAKQ